MELKGYQVNHCFITSPLDLGGVKLVQVGRFFCNPGTVVKVGLHSDFYELTVVTEGSGEIITNDERIAVGKNDVYVSFPFDRHGIVSSETDPLKYDFLSFSIELENYKSALKATATKYYSPDMRVISDPKINQLVQTITGELNVEKEFYKEAIKNAIESVAVYVIRAFDEKDMPDSWNNATEAEILANRIMNYIDTNVYEIENLQSLSAVTGYNYNYLSTLFKRTTGINLRDYYYGKKLEVADMLIREGKLPVCRIAEKLGYSSGAALSKAYKQKYGFSPKTVKPLNP